VVCEFGSGSGKTERDPLIVPGERQTWVFEQLFWRQIARLLPVEDRLDDVRGEIAEADEPREIGRADTFPLGQCCKGHPIATYEHGIKSPRSDQQSNQSRIGFRWGKRIGPIEIVRNKRCVLHRERTRLPYKRQRGHAKTRSDRDHPSPTSWGGSRIGSPEKNNGASQRLRPHLCTWTIGAHGPQRRGSRDHRCGREQGRGWKRLKFAWSRSTLSVQWPCRVSKLLDRDCDPAPDICLWVITVYC